MGIRKIGIKSVGVLLIGIAILPLSACASGGPDDQACGLIQEGWQNIKPLMDNKYWVYDDRSRFQAAIQDFGAPALFISSFETPLADFEAASQSESLSPENKAVIQTLIDSINGRMSPYYKDQLSSSKKAMEINANLVPVLALCSK